MIVSLKLEVLKWKGIKLQDALYWCAIYTVFNFQFVPILILTGHEDWLRCLDFTLTGIKEMYSHPEESTLKPCLLERL